MAKTSTAREMRQESFLREGLEAAIRDRVREVIEMLLQEEVEAALGVRETPGGKKIVSRYHKQARRVYDGAVFEIKKRVPVKSKIADRR